MMVRYVAWADRAQLHPVRMQTCRLDEQKTVHEPAFMRIYSEPLATGCEPETKDRRFATEHTTIVEKLRVAHIAVRTIAIFLLSACRYGHKQGSLCLREHKSKRLEWPGLTGTHV